MKAIMYNYNTWLKYEEEKTAIKKFEKMLSDSGFTIINKVEHFFDTQGYTRIMVIGRKSFCNTYISRRKQNVHRNIKLRKKNTLIIF